MEKNYKFYLWCGAGYTLDGPFEVVADSTEQAIERLVAMLIKNGWCGYYQTEEEYAKFAEWAGVDSSEEIEGWLYVDASMEGAPYPVYLNVMNMEIIEEKSVA